MNARILQPWQGALLGAAGSLAGLLAMQLYWKVSGKLAGSGEQSEEGEAQSGDGKSRVAQALEDVSVVGQQHEEGESAPGAVGRIAYETVVHRSPSKKTKKKLMQGVHWGYGIAVGSLYGALRADAEVPDLGWGLAYGAALWLLGDELMVPLLGLAEGPGAHGPAEHANALGAHLAYGAATAAATQGLRLVA